MNVMDQTYVELLGKQGIHLNHRQLEQFDHYYRLLVEWNERMNLTGITEREQVYVKHFYDSLTLAMHVPVGGIHTIADIGSGAGFPGLPIKIAFPHLKLTIVDSLSKRIGFLQHVAAELGLGEVACIHGRAEDAGRKQLLRDRFDLVTARAVAKLNVLNELCLPFVRSGGLFVAMKGTNPEEEAQAADRSLTELRGSIKAIHSLVLPVEKSERHLIVVEKLGVTPSKYPRKAGEPAKQPL